MANEFFGTRLEEQTNAHIVIAMLLLQHDLLCIRAVGVKPCFFSYHLFLYIMHCFIVLTPFAIVPPFCFGALQNIFKFN